MSCSVTIGQNNTENKQLEAFGLKDSDQIVLDGQLNEGFWSNAVGVSDFTMTVPVEGGDPTEETVVKIVYDENNLYIGVKMLDGDPSEIKSFQKSRDADLSTDDRFAWILDTFQDYRNAYYFEINPA
ncbi:MAG: carbohydrate binding family 9 domain-containing protein, partial [Flavobacteriaceae bacterium]